jgi:hypothetical protein
MGAGQDADGWLAEVATFLEALADPEASLEADEPEATPPTAGPQLPCPLCGSTANWHRCPGAELP